MKKTYALVLLLLVGCQFGDSKDEPFEGVWNAKWVTDPAAYGDLAGIMSFEMYGKFEFEENNLTISAYGYDGCIFYGDTLEHTQNWVYYGDTLELQNSPGEPGIQYKVLEQTANKVELQLVDDIFITLTK